MTVELLWSQLQKEVNLVSLHLQGSHYESLRLGNMMEGR